MSTSTVLVADTSARWSPGKVTGNLVCREGERFYRLENQDAMPPFLMTLVSDSDHWLFISSYGGLTAGRKNPDHSLFPYVTDDRLHESHEHTGSKTILRITRRGQTWLWEPFSARYDGLYTLSRSLLKSVYGNKIVFEEFNRDLQLGFSYAWTTSARFGFVRRATLENHGAEVAVEVLDGIQNVLPCGITRRFQMEYSTLADGYKRTELAGESDLALFRLSSIPVDKAEPCEALRVNTAFCLGLEDGVTLLSATQLDAFRRGCPLRPEADVIGRRGAYFRNATIKLSPGGKRDWKIVAELDQDVANVKALLKELDRRQELQTAIEDDVQRGTRSLVRLVASADGIQFTSDEPSIWRHYSNTLFNVMRGGVFDHGYLIGSSDLRSFVAKANRELAGLEADFLNSLPQSIAHKDLLARVREHGNTNLERLICEYLPLTFSRRHGDPSRPWNIFSIEVQDDHGRKILNYQGNWRDIFQNWEALAFSFPSFVESMIFKFLNSSTADGYNPYRVMRNGFDWEVFDPDDSWSFIGYWGDHQIVYLLKLLEASRHYSAEMLTRLLTRPVFAFADVPYRINAYEALLENPHSTIRFDLDAHREAMDRVAINGSDGRLQLDADGKIRLANLTEKLLITALARWTNYIPEGGIWMNTQRPEWNDANNALVGYGVSMVTLCYLRRFLAFCRDLFASSELSRIEVSSPVVSLFHSVLATLQQYEPLLDGPISDADRKAVLDALGKAGSAYRAAIYEKRFSGQQASISAAELIEFCTIGIRHADHSIRSNRREDGLYHAYNLMQLRQNGIGIRRLYEMLEGQVAVLSSGTLSPVESVAVLDALRSSALYRADQNSYVLYPSRALPRFLDKNIVPESAVRESALLTELLKNGDRRIVVRDLDGVVHFNAAFRSRNALTRALARLSNGYQDLLRKEEQVLLDLYERVFEHQSFTGRSGTFYKYEGLGCIYWHMVSKLLLAVNEVMVSATASGADTATLDRLKLHYQEIRQGIGVHKSPLEYGAIPIDPHSHTPSFAGAQQPGMTGQVKEDFLARFGEMGVVVSNQQLEFRPALFCRDEFLHDAGSFQFYDVNGAPQSIELESGTLAFTICQVPVVVHRAGPARIEALRADQSRHVVQSLTLDSPTSSGVFERDGATRRLDVFLGLSGCRPGRSRKKSRNGRH
jgi:hypothetical protein